MGLRKAQPALGIGNRHSATVLLLCNETWNKINLTRPSPKKICFRFLLQYYYGAEDLEKFQSTLDLIEKKIVSSYGYY